MASACAPLASDGASPRAGSTIEHRVVEFATADGTLDGELFAKPGGKAPGVIFWPDIAGIRPAKRQMARRLAEAGYAVLLANPYYRDVKGEQFADFAAFAGGGGFEKVAPWRARLTVETAIRDNRAAAEWLAQQSAVDKTRGMGTQGYCMTGSTALVGPAALDRIRAGASLHGGGLVSTRGTSPHTLMRPGKRYLIAIAQNDDAKAPADKTTLREAAAQAGAQAEIEVYPADHGWCVPDSPSYNAAEAERAWTRLLAIYKAAL